MTNIFETNKQANNKSMLNCTHLKKKKEKFTVECTCKIRYFQECSSFVSLFLVNTTKWDTLLCLGDHKTIRNAQNTLNNSNTITRALYLILW